MRWPLNFSVSYYTIVYKKGNQNTYSDARITLNMHEIGSVLNRTDDVNETTLAYLRKHAENPKSFDIPLPSSITENRQQSVHIHADITLNLPITSIESFSNDPSSSEDETRHLISFQLGNDQL